MGWCPLDHNTMLISYMDEKERSKKELSFIAIAKLLTQAQEDLDKDSKYLSDLRVAVRNIRSDDPILPLRKREIKTYMGKVKSGENVVHKLTKQYDNLRVELGY